MRTSIYDFVGVVIAIFICIVIFIGVIKPKLGGRNFSSGDNLKWCAYLVAWAAVAPLLYWWGSPTKISFADAYLLRVTAAGRCAADLIRKDGGALA